MKSIPLTQVLGREVLRIFPGLPTGTLYHQIGNGMCWKIIMGTRKAEFSGRGITNPRLWYQETRNWQKLALKYGLPEDIALYEAVIMACANSDAKSSADVARQSFERAKKIPKLKCLGRPRKRSEEQNVKQSRSFFSAESIFTFKIFCPDCILLIPIPKVSTHDLNRSRNSTNSIRIPMSWLVSTMFGQHWWSPPCQASLEHLQRLDRCCGTSWRFEVGRTHLCQDHWRRATTRSSDLHYDAWKRFHQLTLRKVGFLLYPIVLSVSWTQSSSKSGNEYIL